MDSMIYIDGKFYSKGEAKVSVYDHGLLYGDGVFEGIRCYNGNVFRLKQHIDRLYDSARAIALEIKESKRGMEEIVLNTLRENKLKEAIAAYNRFSFLKYVCFKPRYRQMIKQAQEQITTKTKS